MKAFNWDIKIWGGTSWYWTTTYLFTTATLFVIQTQFILFFGLLLEEDILFFVTPSK